MNIYCVWFDNFLQELFAIEQKEFEQYDKLKQALKIEKNTIHLIEAESCVDAFAQYKKKQEQPPAFSQKLH